VAAIFGLGGFHTVEHDKEFRMAAQVKELARHFADFLVAIAFGDIRRGIGVIRVVLERHNVAAFAREPAAFIDMPQETAIVFVVFITPASFLSDQKP